MTYNVRHPESAQLRRELVSVLSRPCVLAQLHVDRSVGR